MVVTYVMERKRHVAELAVEFDLTPGDLQLLLTIDPDEPRPMKALAESFRCDPSNATWMVDRLEQRGLVERRTMPHDRRVRAVVFTVDGRALRARLEARLAKAPPEMASLTYEELEGLAGALAKLAGRRI